MEASPIGVDELVERWTVLPDERDLVAGKRGATRLGFALLLKLVAAVLAQYPTLAGRAGGEADGGLL